MSERQFSPRTEALLVHAGEICGARGARMTPIRRQVLGLILDAPGPAGAYDLLDRLRQDHDGAAPPTVYRALDFLLEHGLIHRLERLSAFVGCVAHDHHADDAEPCTGARAHPAQFLICRSCGRATELDDPGVAAALSAAAARAGFALSSATVEAEGICRACAAAS